MFVDVSFNFTPFLSQVVAYLLTIEQFPGTYTTYGGASLFIGCTLLSMSYKDQEELAKVPLIDNEIGETAAELKKIVPKSPIKELD